MAGLALGGRVRVGSETRTLSGQAATLEYVNGFFPHQLAWSSAALLGRPAAYLSDLGCLGADVGENAAWPLGADMPRALGAASFALPEPARPGRGPWSIASGDGRVRLGFTPRAVRAQGRTLPTLMGSSHAWVFGTFDGDVDGAAVAGQPGLRGARDLRW
ncbi:MAG: DUF2804 family protein [Myxococcota bacterium]